MVIIKIVRVLILIILTVVILNCSNQDCKCLLDNSTIHKNDSIIESIDLDRLWSRFGKIDLRNQQAEIYRLLIFPTWTGDKSVFTLVNEADSCYISVDIFERLDADTFAVKLYKEDKIILTKKQWNDFDQFVNSNCFWTATSNTGRMYLDGVNWALEGKKRIANRCTDRDFHYASRVADDSTFFEICDKILRLANSSKATQDSLLRDSWTSF